MFGDAVLCVFALVPFMSTSICMCAVMCDCIRVRSCLCVRVYFLGMIVCAPLLCGCVCACARRRFCVPGCLNFFGLCGYA